MVTASRHDRTTTRNSSCFKLYRHIEFDLTEKEPVQSNAERREEATQAASTQAASTQQTAEEQATAPQASAPAPEKSKRQAKEESQAAKRELNPPTRSSDRLKAKKEKTT